MLCPICRLEFESPDNVCPKCGGKVYDPHNKANTSVSLKKQGQENTEPPVSAVTDGVQTVSAPSAQSSVPASNSFLDVFTKVTGIAAIVCLLMFIIACILHKVLAAVVAVFPIALFITAILMHKGAIKVKGKGIPILLTVIAFLLIVPLCASFAVGGTKSVDWPESGLGAVLPKPDTPVKKIDIDSEYHFSARISGTRSDYEKYVQKCRDSGFTIDEHLEGTFTYIFNSEGYEMHSYYNDYGKEINVSVEPPIKMSEIKWPNSEIAALLPVPKSNYGKFSYEHSDHFYVYIGNTTKSDFHDYVEQCASRGFNVDYEKNDDYYCADNADCYRISLEYEYFNTMSIEIEKREKKEESSSVSESSVSSVPESSSSASESSSSASEPPESSSEGSSPAPSVSGDTVRVGETHQVSNWEITIHEVKAVDKLVEDFMKFTPKEEGNVYLKIDVTFRNLGYDDDYILPTFYFSDDMKAVLRYGDEEFKPSDLVLYSKTLNDCMVSSQGVKRGDIIFSIPKEKSGDLSKLVLEIKKSYDKANFSMV